MKFSKLNSLIRGKVSFVGAQAKVMPVVHGGRSCSWALYRFQWHYSHRSESNGTCGRSTLFVTFKRCGLNMSISHWWQLCSTRLYPLCFPGILIIGMKFGINCTWTTFNLELIMPGNHLMNNYSNFQFRIATGQVRQSDLERSASFWYLFSDILNLKNTLCLFIYITIVYFSPQFHPVICTWIHRKTPFWLPKLAQRPHKHNFDSQKRNGLENTPSLEMYLGVFHVYRWFNHYFITGLVSSVECDP